MITVSEPGLDLGQGFVCALSLMLVRNRSSSGDRRTSPQAQVAAAGVAYTRAEQSAATAPPSPPATRRRRGRRPSAARASDVARELGHPGLQRREVGVALLRADAVPLDEAARRQDVDRELG